MQESHEVNQMIKRFKWIDLIIGIILIGITYIVNNRYTIVCILGFILAVINFYINAYIVKYAFSKENVNSTLIITLGYFIRVLLISIIGIIIFTYNKFNLIAYVLGYTFRFFSLIFYALLENNAGRG